MPRFMLQFRYICTRIGEKVFDALDRLAAMCSHVHDKGKQMVKYYGYYSNCSRGKRREKSRDDVIPAIMETQVDRKTIRKNWYA